MKKYLLVLLGVISIFSFILISSNDMYAEKEVKPGKLTTFGNYLACECPNSKKDCVCVIIRD